MQASQGLRISIKDCCNFCSGRASAQIAQPHAAYFVVIIVYFYRRME